MAQSVLIVIAVLDHSDPSEKDIRLCVRADFERKTHISRVQVFTISQSAPGRIRTYDLRIRRPPLYPLSYGGNRNIILRIATVFDFS